MLTPPPPFDLSFLMMVYPYGKQELGDGAFELCLRDKDGVWLGVVHECFKGIWFLATQDAVSVQDQSAPGVPVLCLEVCAPWAGLRWEGRWCADETAQGVVGVWCAGTWCCVHFPEDWCAGWYWLERWLSSAGYWRDRTHPWAHVSGFDVLATIAGVKSVYRKVAVASEAFPGSIIHLRILADVHVVATNVEPQGAVIAGHSAILPFDRQLAVSTRENLSGVGVRTGVERYVAWQS